MAQEAYRLEFKPSFVRSVDDEMEYWQRASPEKAKRLLEGLLQLIDAIERMPLMYPECEQLPTKAKLYRVAVLAPQYKVIYKVKGGMVSYLCFFNTKRHPGGIRSLRQK